MWEADDSQDLWATPGNSPAASMAHGERMVGSELTSEDLDVDRTLRPQRLDDYCGQEHIKQSLRVLIEAAQSRGETLDHVIFRALRVWARPRWPPLSPTSWALRSRRRAARPSRAPATWRLSLPTCSRVTCCLSTRSTVLIVRSRKSCIPLWRTLRSIS